MSTDFTADMLRVLWMHIPVSVMGAKEAVVMKKITMFHITECKYCDMAGRAIAELREENPEYNKALEV